EGTAKGPLSPEQTLVRYRIGDLRLSPDGRSIALSVTEPVEGTKSNSDVWLIDVESRDVRRMTTSKKSDNHARWSPDGKTLAFLSSRAEKRQIYLLSMAGGEGQPLTESETGIRSFAWSPDGASIAFLAATAKTEEEKEKEKKKDDAQVADTMDQEPQLWLIDVESQEVRQLTEPPWRISEYLWSPDGERLVLSATDRPQPELETNKVFALRVADGEMTEIASPAHPFGRMRISPAGDSLAFLGAKGDGPSARDLFVLSMDDLATRNLTGEAIDRVVNSFSWQQDGTILAQVADGFSTVFYHITNTGDVTALPGIKVQPSGSFAAGADVLAFVGETATQAPEVWIRQGKEKAEPVTTFHKEWNDIGLVSPEIIRYPSFDGTIIEAALLKPDNAQGRLPLVVLVHGGPTGRFSDRWDRWGQLLVARGFAVLSPNIRGSLGYGEEFMRSNRKDWGGADFKDVMAGVDHLIEAGIADPDRLAIGGWSYGGYMAAWAVTQTDRFNASISGAPMTDLAFEYGAETASINPYDTWFMGTPYENLDLFTERSPVTHVKNATTPTLILCGENDDIDPVEQCTQFYRGLKRYGVETELVIYPREGHGIREEKHQIDLLNRMIDWYEKYLR
ncbi:MAG: S9 family peptidase, partial [bacterium]|nr:S9 family peptidase [bacterium]